MNNKYTFLVITLLIFVSIACLKFYPVIFKKTNDSKCIINYISSENNSKIKIYSLNENIKVVFFGNEK
ncbi:MAG: hypothetical protein ACD_79C00650G0009 [uncultured bacterium]|nr:MAG: hypothetical protein ACD_79C00650G0009 [uncultured bacterium]